MTVSVELISLRRGGGSGGGGGKLSSTEEWGEKSAGVPNKLMRAWLRNENGK